MGLLARVIVMFSVLMGSAAFAKDLSHRLGVGYANNSSIDVPSVTGKYYASPDFAIGASLGVDTQKNASRFALSARLYKTIFVEENLNFYGGAGAGSVSHEELGNNISGFELSGFLGCEFFLPGLESLGISFDAGVGVTSDSSGTRFRTIADHPLRAGMVFYF